MKFLKTNTILFIAVLGIVFLNFKVASVSAFEEYSCSREADTCSKIAADPYERARGAECSTRQTAACITVIESLYYDARMECNFFCGKPKPICNYEDHTRCPLGPIPSGCKLSKNPCPEPFGCVTNGNCEDIQAFDHADAVKKCQYGEALATKCPPLKKWRCFQGEQCETIEAVNYQAANYFCQSSCPTCDLAEDACPPTGTNIGELQDTSSEVLNPANIRTPAALIRRVINLLMAFIGSITLVLYVFAGILWMTASGSSERIDKAKQILVWTTLGITVMLFSYILVNFLFSVVPK